jgi:hypothetical protein
MDRIGTRSILETVLETPSLDPSKEIRLLQAFFGESSAPHFEGVSAEDVPQPFRQLLVHHNHMTATLEDYYQSPLRVVPYKVHRNGEVYGRKLDLLIPSNKVVMTGIMLINFGFCGTEVRDEILAETKPLGRVLIEHNIMREVTATAFVRVPAEEPLLARFQLAKPKATYGRFATIVCDGHPAVDLLEIVAPE